MSLSVTLVATEMLNVPLGLEFRSHQKLEEVRSDNLQLLVQSSGAASRGLAISLMMIMVNYVHRHMVVSTGRDRNWGSDNNYPPTYTR